MNTITAMSTCCCSSQTTYTAHISAYQGNYMYLQHITLYTIVVKAAVSVSTLRSVYIISARSQSHTWLVEGLYQMRQWRVSVYRMID